MRRIALLLIALCLSLPALAERKQTFGDLDGDNTVGARDLGVLLGRFGVVMY